MEWSLTQNKLLAFHRLMRTDKPIGALLLLWPTLWALWVATPGVTGYRSASSAGVTRLSIRAVRSSSVLFITSLRNLLLLRQDCREVMRITINQSLLISSARCVTPRRVVSMITKK